MNALKQIGLEYIGDAADAVEWTENKGRGAWNKLVKIGEEYFLQEGDTSGLTVNLLEPGSGRQDIIANAAKSNINLDIAANDKEAIARFDALSIDKREDFHKGIIKRDNEIFRDTKETIEGGRDATLNVLEKFYIDLSSYNDAQANKAGHRKTINKAKKLLELKKPLEPREIKNLHTQPIKEITNANSAINKNIISQDNKIKKIVKGYSTAVNKADKKGKEVPKSVLDNKQAAYLKAVENMNKGLDKKDALIGKAQQESFWAFVARVGANISKGVAISSAVADELPQAMKDRQSLIQAKSDLADKKLQGKVSLAKADLTIETADAAAIAKATESSMERINKMNIALIAANNKSNYFKGNLEDTKDFIDENINYLDNYVQSWSDANKQKLINSAPQLKNITLENFDSAFDSFLTKVKPEHLFVNLKNDVNTEARTPSKLVSKHVLELWKRSSGNYTGEAAWWNPRRWAPGDSAWSDGELLN